MAKGSAGIDFEAAPLVFIDCETTGLDADKHVLTEVAALVVSQRCLDESRAAYSSRIHVGIDDLLCAEPDALKLNGFNPGRPAPDLTGVMHCLAFVLPETGILISSNPDFDRRFLRAAERKTGVQLPALYHHAIDLFAMAWGLGIRVGGLSGLAEAVGLEPEQAPHRAPAGAELAWRVYQRLVARRAALTRVAPAESVQCQ